MDLSKYTAPYVVTIDVGTSATRAILYDSRGAIVEDCIAQRSNRAQTSNDGGAVFQADQLFGAVVEVVDEVLRKAGPMGNRIGAVAMDTLVGNVVGISAAGTPVSPVYTYADTRNAQDAQTLRLELGEEGIQEAHDRTGCLIHTSYLPARFRWLERTQPQLLDTARLWASIGEYIYFRLFGIWRVSYSVASWSGMLNRRELAWDAEWLERLPAAASNMSPLGDLATPMLGLKDEWAARWPSLAEIPWLLAIGDGAAVNVGSGCDVPERIALTVGSTGAMRVVIGPDIAEVPTGLWLYRVDAGRALLGGATTEGGNLFSWLRDTLVLPEPENLEELLREMPPDAHGLTLLPFISGERAPGWREEARAAIQGLSLHTQPIDIVLASLEAIAYRFAIIYRRILPNLPDTAEHKIIGSGGGLLGSAAWMQIFANVLGEPVYALHEKETTSRGLALLALEHLGVIDRPSALPPETGAIYRPDPRCHEAYAEAIQRQASLYSRLLD